MRSSDCGCADDCSGGCLSGDCISGGHSVVDSAVEECTRASLSAASMRLLSSGEGPWLAAEAEAAAAATVALSARPLRCAIAA